MIQFYSTKNKQLNISLEEAVLRGIYDDGGLFMPHVIPPLPEAFFKEIYSLSFPDIAFNVCKHLFQDAIPERDLKTIIGRSINFDAPLKSLSQDIYTLELFHGPTLSFKDFGARFMAELLGYFVKQREKTLNILVATSGDTGSAIAQGFFNVPGIRIWILYPKGGVSQTQEKQLTTMGNNITALEIEGTFDDCQRLVKQTFSDSRVREKINLTSANSINIARLIPQSFYYFYGFAQLRGEDPVVFSVPSGNFGNLTAGLLAKRMGLPIAHFVAATNINDSVPKYLRTGIFEPHSSKRTLSNAMDVGNPSNFDRMLDLYNYDVEAMRQEITGASFTDRETESAMREVFSNHGYLLDPHGAVAYLGLQAFVASQPNKVKGVFLETAHPAKFSEDVERVTGQKAPVPNFLQEVLSKEKRSSLLSTNYEELCDLLTCN